MKYLDTLKNGCFCAYIDTFRPTRKVQVTIDASADAICAVVEQVIEKWKRPVAYTLRTFNAEEC